MKKELVLLAALALPLHAQQTATPPSKVLTAMTAPAKATSAKAAERAKVFSALSKLPKDTGDFLVVTPTTAAMVAPVLLSGQDADPGTMVSGAAIASSAKNAPIYLPVLQVVQMEKTCKNLDTSTADLSSPELKAEVQKLAAAMDKEAAAIAKALAGKKIYPVYFVCDYASTPTMEEEPAPAQTLEGALAHIKATMEAMGGAHPGLDALLAEAAKHPMVMKKTVVGNSVIIYMCEKGTEPKFAATPEESVLATDKTACSDANLKQTMLGLLYWSPELHSAFSKSSLSAMKYNRCAAAVTAKAHGATAKQISTLDKAWPMYESWAKAMSGQEAKKPGHIQVWSNSDMSKYHLESTMDACGNTYTAGTLMHTAIADAKNTFLYLESTPYKYPQGAPSLAKALPAMLMEAFSDENSDGEDMMAQVASLAGDISTLNDGLDGHFTLVADCAAKSKEDKSPFPRLGYYNAITDEAKLTTGWNMLLKHVGPLMGADDAKEMLNVKQKKTKTDGVSYRANLPFCEGDFTPNTTIEGTHMAAGSSIKLNSALIKAAKGQGVPFSGAVFMLRTEPLAKCLKAMSQGEDALVPAEAVGMVKTFKSVFGAATISNGTWLIRLDVNLK